MHICWLCNIYFILLRLINSIFVLMGKKFTVILVFMSLAFNAFANDRLAVTPLDTLNQNYVLTDIEKKNEVKISSAGSQLVIVSDETIARVDIYSAIGGMLSTVKTNSKEVRIDNLPKSFLVVRIRFANNQTSIYKIRHN